MSRKQLECALDLNKRFVPLYKYQYEKKYLRGSLLFCEKERQKLGFSVTYRKQRGLVVNNKG